MTSHAEVGYPEKEDLKFGKSQEEADVRAKTGCTVVGIDKHETTITDLRPHTTFPAGSEIVLIGSADGEVRFLKTFGAKAEA